MKSSEIRLRPEQPGDVPFLRRLYATTRPDVAMSGLPLEQQQHFLDMQFEAQRAHYSTHYENPQFSIIERRGLPVGRLYVDYKSDEVRLVDISVLPEYRNQGIGSRLLKAVQTQAGELRVPVRLHAEKFGQMEEYYKRFGFEIIEEKEAHWFMQWTSGSSVIIS